ncbi:hypothetical protein GCM10010912_37110 [Paenibacillus albidus]|uniref:SLH domain-containing protein n=1 Tax=Paenibacillus albidus TaxID=2041023 RepID=A0A917CIF1_9BACL|nr:S-layer homology domain-containing protein [Paenibacillus albidus]GGF88446.1 hypothetical protein GCM10010912_37110 [Paenibacillus albidus]
MTVLKKAGVLLLALLLLVPFGAWTQTTAGAETAVQDGTYSDIFYRYLKDNSTADSAAHVFLNVEHSGKLTVQGGQVIFEHEVAADNYALIPYIGFRKPGSAKAVINGSDVQGKEGYQPYSVDSGSGTAGNLKVALNIEDIRKPTDILMHVIIQDHPKYPGLNYDYWYNAQLWLDTSSLGTGPGEGEEPGGGGELPEVTLGQLQELITVSRSVYDNTAEGTDFGQYPAGSRAVLYDHITRAETIAGQSGPTEDVIKTAYDELSAGLAQYKASVYTADKAALKAIIMQTEQLLSGLKETGSAEGKAGYIFAPVSAGEYMKGVSSSLNGNILQTAKALLANDSALQSQVDASVKALTTRFNNNKDRYYVVTEPIAVHVVDTLEPTATFSVYAGDFGSTAVLLKNQWNEFNDKLHANLIFTNPQIREVVQSTPTFAGDFSTNRLDYSQEQYRAIALTQGSTETQKLYQVTIRNVMGTAAAGANWLGLSYVRYQAGAETRGVYISYNTGLLKALNAGVAEAAQFLSHTVAPKGAEQRYAVARAKVEQAVQAAEQTGSNLSATRPQIAAAAQGLQATLDELKQNVAYPVNVSVADGNKDAFSLAAGYFRNQALVATVAGDTYGLVRTNPIVEELQVRAGEEWLTAEYADETLGEPVRSFKVKSIDPAGLTSARVRIGGTLYAVRLNFGMADNSRLAEVLTGAQQYYDAAESGTEPGQYPAEAKAVLAQAIAQAHTAAADLAGSQMKSDTLLAALEDALARLKASVIPQPGTPVEEPGTGPDPGPGPDPGTGPNPGTVPDSGNGPDAGSGSGSGAGNSSPASPAATPSSGGAVPGVIVAGGGTTASEEPGPPDVGQISFSDIQGHWALEAIRQAASLGIAKGFEDGSFRPEAMVTRAEFAVFISRALKLNTDASAAIGFTDQQQIPGWAQDAVTELYGAGLLRGYADGSFQASGRITRAEIAVIAARAARLTLEGQQQPDFTDSNSIPVWARSELAAVVRAKLMQGKDGNRFDPLANATRAEVITLVIRLLELP